MSMHLATKIESPNAEEKTTKKSKFSVLTDQAI